MKKNKGWRVPALLSGALLLAPLAPATAQGPNGSQATRGSERKVQKAGSDKLRYVGQVIRFDETQIALGRLALERSDNRQIHRLAQTMIDNHTRHLSQLGAWARARAAELRAAQGLPPAMGVGGAGAAGTSTQPQTQPGMQGQGMQGQGMGGGMMQPQQGTQGQGMQQGQPGMGGSGTSDMMNEPPTDQEQPQGQDTGGSGAAGTTSGQQTDQGMQQDQGMPQDQGMQQGQGMQGQDMGNRILQPPTMEAPSQQGMQPPPAPGVVGPRTPGSQGEVSTAFESGLAGLAGTMESYAQRAEQHRAVMSDKYGNLLKESGNRFDRDWVDAVKDSQKNGQSLVQKGLDAYGSDAAFATLLIRSEPLIRQNLAEADRISPSLR